MKMSRKGKRIVLVEEYSKTFYRCLNLHTTLSSFFGAIPFQRNKKPGEYFIITKASLRRFHRFFAFIVLTIILQDIRISPIVMSNTTDDLNSMAFGIALSFVTHFSFMPYFALWLDPVHCKATFNAILQYPTKFNGNIINYLHMRWGY